MLARWTAKEWRVWDASRKLPDGGSVGNAAGGGAGASAGKPRRRRGKAVGVKDGACGGRLGGHSCEWFAKQLGALQREAAARAVEVAELNAVLAADRSHLAARRVSRLRL